MKPKSAANDATPRAIIPKSSTRRSLSPLDRYSEFAAIVPPSPGRFFFALSGLHRRIFQIEGKRVLQIGKRAGPQRPGTLR